MKNEIKVIFLYMIGVCGSGHHMRKKAKKQPMRKVGMVQLLLYPTSPLRLVKVINIFHPNMCSAQLPRLQIKARPMTSEVISWKTNCAVTILQNSKCLRCYGLNISGSSWNVGMRRNGGNLQARIIYTMMMSVIRIVVRDLSL